MVKEGQHERLGGAARAAAGLLLAIALVPEHAAAQRIENGVAVFAALDKVTARISKLPIKLGETVKFGALKLTPRACYTRQPTEPPKTTSFVEVQETQLDGTVNKIFSGWMFAESPGLNAVEHPVYDVWLTDCIEPARPVAVPRAAPPGSLPAPIVKGGQPGQPRAAGAPAPRVQPRVQQPTTVQTPPGTFEQEPELRSRPRR
jgi:hypothetical protein